MNFVGNRERREPDHEAVHKGQVWPVRHVLPGAACGGGLPVAQERGGDRRTGGLTGAAAGHTAPGGSGDRHARGPRDYVLAIAELIVNLV